MLNIHRDYVIKTLKNEPTINTILKLAYHEYAFILIYTSDDKRICKFKLQICLDKLLYYNVYLIYLIQEAFNNQTQLELTFTDRDPACTVKFALPKNRD